MVYVALTSVTLKKNPIKRTRFMLYTTRHLLQANGISLLAETNSINGQFLTMTVWENLAEMLAFQQVANTRKSTRNLIQDVAKDSVMYSFETHHLPSWEEAVDLLDAAKNGSVHAMKSSRELMLEQRMSDSWRRMTAITVSN